MWFSFLLCLSSFALGIAAYRQWPDDGALGALADLAELPFRWIAQLKSKEAAPAASVPPANNRVEKPAA